MSTLSLGSPRFTRQRTIAPAFPGDTSSSVPSRPRCRNRIDRRRRRLRQRNAPAVFRCRAEPATSFRSQSNLRSFDAGREQALLTAGVDDVNLTPQRRLPIRTMRGELSVTAAPIRHEIEEEGAVARELCSADLRDQTIRDRLTSEDHPAGSGQCPSDQGDLQVEGGWQNDHALNDASSEPRTSGRSSCMAATRRLRPTGAPCGRKPRRARRSQLRDKPLGQQPSRSRPDQLVADVPIDRTNVTSREPVSVSSSRLRLDSICRCSSRCDPSTSTGGAPRASRATGIGRR